MIISCRKHVSVAFFAYGQGYAFCSGALTRWRLSGGGVTCLPCCTQLIVALSLLLLYAAAAAVAAAPAAVLRSCILLRSYAGRCHRVCSYHDHE